MNNQKRTPLGVYVHIPFCLRKCYYCDFCSSPATDDEKEAYVDALCREILSFDAEGYRVDTLFFGGGTPSLLGEDLCNRIMEALHRRFSFAEGAECSMEVNPATVKEEAARAYLAAGFNRMSVGVQSLRDEELRTLGRLHTAREAVSCVDMLHRVGFDNINLDLMYGIPTQTLATFDQTIEGALRLSPAHVSAYALILEEGTPLYRRRADYVFPSDDEVYDMYKLLIGRMREASFRHYEISNFAKKHRACRHNLRYWRRRDYVGFGTAAHSCIAGVRSENTESMERYLQEKSPKVAEEVLSERAAAEERVMLGLRLDTGVFERDLAALSEKPREAFLDDCERAGYLIRRGGRVFLSDDGMYVSNGILCELLPNTLV